MHPQASQIMPTGQLLAGDWNWAVEVAGGVGAQAVLASLLSVVGFLIIATLTRRLGESVKAVHLAMQLLRMPLSREYLIAFLYLWGCESESPNCGGLLTCGGAIDRASTLSLASVACQVDWSLETLCFGARQPLMSSNGHSEWCGRLAADRRFDSAHG